jgi:Fe-S-cluster-containing dehydrogenase component
MGNKIFVVDVTKCTGCFNCFIACKDEFADHPWPPYSEPQPETGHYWIKVDEVERGQFPRVKLSFIAQPCQHCGDPRCIKAARKGAVYKRKDGLVIIDMIKSKGQKRIVEACPYQRIYWNEELDVPQKCTGCVHLLEDGWEVPRCVEACPTEAILFGDRKKLSKLIKKAEPLHPEYGTDPSVYYIGLPKAFIAGSVYCGESQECLENARVTLTHGMKKKPMATKTNNYGDFEFEGLEANKNYSIKIEAKGYYPVSINDINLKNSITMENIHLQKRI